jgi:hypothetical protein
MTALMGGSGAGKTSVSILSLYCMHDVLISFVVCYLIHLRLSNNDLLLCSSIIALFYC